MDKNNQYIIERLRHSAYEDGLAHYPGIEHDARIVCDIARAAPAWHRKPTWPGRYVCTSEGWEGFGHVHFQSPLHVDGATDGWYYGPIPQPPEGE